MTLLEDIKILWSTSWYDGPLSGICLYQDKRYWFEYVDGDRIYSVKELSDEQLEEEESKYVEFLKRFGDDNDPIVSEEDRDYSGNKVIGQFEW